MFSPRALEILGLALEVVEKEPQEQDGGENEIGGNTSLELPLALHIFGLLPTYFWPSITF